MKKYVGSTTFVYVSFVLALCFPDLSHADRFHSIFEDDHWHSNPIDKYTYKECLRDVVQKNQNLSAEDIRALCKEITTKPDPVWKYENGELVPANDFTRCYAEMIDGTPEADSPKTQELAKALCYYSD